MTKYAATGTKLTRGTYPGTELAQATNISGPNISVDMVDVSEHDGDNWEEFVATILRSGNITVDIIYDPDEDTHTNATAGLMHDLVNRTKSVWNLVLPTTPVRYFSFEAYVAGFTPTAPVAGVLTASVTLKPTGAITPPLTTTP